MYLLFEAGGTRTRIGFSPDGVEIENTQIVDTAQDFGEFLSLLKEQANKLGDIKGVCGGMAVVFNKDITTPITSAHLPKWVGVPVKEELEKALHKPIYLENDTALGALGEAVKGAGAQFQIIAFITVGTGIGGARIVDRKIDRKIYGFEPGHQIIVPDGDSCTCGGRGHWEAYVGGWYLEKKYKQKGENIKDPNIWDQVARYLAIGLYNTNVYWSPDVIILGGSVSSSIPLEKVKKYLQEFSTIYPEISIHRASLGDQAGLYGALGYLNQLKYI